MPTQQKPAGNEYRETDIVYLEPRQHIRKRPGMYIGGTDKRALHHLVWIALDDALSEFEETIYNTITISLLPDKTICISDDGAGLPLQNSDSGKSFIESYMTSVGASGRIWLKDKQRKASIGLIGVGIPAINALSLFCKLEIKCGGFLWQQTYSEGLETSPLEQIRPLEGNEATGTSISFRPDFSILDENDFDFELIAKHCQELAYLMPQIRFTVQDNRETRQEKNFHFPKGLIEWVKMRAGSETAITEPLTISYDCDLLDKQEKPYTVTIQLAFQWLKTDKNLLYSFINTIPTPDGGTQIEALEIALKKQFRRVSRRRLKSGFLGIIHILHPDPQFERHVRLGLINTDIFTAIDEAIEALFAAHPEAKSAIQAHFKTK